jgi:phosphohistidine phosphatase SixA
LATPTTIQQIVAQNHGNKTKVMCIGHNPGIENLASELANKNLEMKTAHLIVFERETDWANASQIGKGWKLLRNLRGEDS